MKPGPRKLDTYPDMGKVSKHYSLDDCLMQVKKHYPECWMEGSAGLQRSFFVQVEGRNLLAGYCWSSGKLNVDFNYTWYVRVADKPREW